MSLPPFAICQCVTGRPDYFAAAKGSIQSVRRHTDASLVITTHNPDAIGMSDDPRVTVIPMPPADHERAAPFLAKFKALRAGLAHTDAPIIMLLDVDTRIVRRTTAADVQAALGDHDFAMVEQPGIIGSSMSRADFLTHYTDHSLAFIAPGSPSPGLEEFRYHNSGVVLGRRDAWEELVTFVDARVASASGAHQVGIHMIADQDYMQYWVNTHRPGCCRDLPREWNHSDRWDDDFPCSDARILHFSNFYNGPDPEAIVRMDGVSRAAERRARLRRLWPLRFRRPSR